VQAEYVERYGGPDETPARPGEFAAPLGLFLVAWLDGEPIGCGGWRVSQWPDTEPGTVEIKRMFVVARARGRGPARAILAELERTAAAAGHRDVILETGSCSRRAVVLYRSSGYTQIAGFDHNAGRPLSLSFGKPLP
jgi:GNAT superfamily N-acetyltransferase